MLPFSCKSISTTKMHLNAMADCAFPEDIMVSILTRLPVKSIARFKSVCKHWFELLSSQNFKILHYGEFSRDPRNHSFILNIINKNSSNTSSLFKMGRNEMKPTILDHSFSYTHNCIDFIGCCNELVCLSISEPRNMIHLWNPALKLSKEVLPLEECGLKEMASLGFGYDAAKDDFKVVRIVGLHIPIQGVGMGVGMNVNGVEVYSSNSDSWTRIEVDFLLGVICTKSSVNVNGNPYWIARVGEDVRDRNRVIACFDVTEMVFKIFPLSIILDQYHDDDGVGRGVMRLCDFNGCLSVLMFDIDYVGVVEYRDVWVFDDSEQVWRNIHSVESIELDLQYMLPGTIDGDIFWMRRDGKLIVFDPDDECIKLIFSSVRPFEDLQLCGYTESLAYIEAMKKVKTRKRTGKRKMIDG